MIFKITIKETMRNNNSKAEVGMYVEISSKQLSGVERNYINHFKFNDNNDIKVIRDAFMQKYGVDLYQEGLLSYPGDKYLKCEPL